MNIDKIENDMGKARHLRKEIEERLQGGESPTSEAIQTLYREAEMHLEAAEFGMIREDRRITESDLALASFVPSHMGNGHRGDLRINTREYRSAFEKYLRHGIRDLHPDEHRVMQVAVDEMGGYLVPPDVQGEILRRVPAVAVTWSGGWES